MKTLFKPYFRIPFLNLFNVITVSSVAWNYKNVPSVWGCVIIIGLVNIFAVNKFRIQ